MPQFIPGAPGLYPYPNAGRNDYEGIGNILQGLTGAMAFYGLGRQQNRTLSDVFGQPKMQFNPARGEAPQPSPGIRDMLSGMSPLSALGRSQPQPMAVRGQMNPMQPPGQMNPMQPMAVRGQMNPMQAMIMNSGMGGMRMRDLKTASEGAPFLKLLMGQNEDDLLLKRLLTLSQIKENQSTSDKNNVYTGAYPGMSEAEMRERAARAKYYNSGGSPRSGGNKRTPANEADTYADKQMIGHPLYQIPDLSPDEQQEYDAAWNEARDTYIRRRSGKGGKSSVKSSPISGKTKSGISYTIEK